MLQHLVGLRLFSEEWERENSVPFFQMQLCSDSVQRHEKYVQKAPLPSLALLLANDFLLTTSALANAQHTSVHAIVSNEGLENQTQKKYMEVVNFAFQTSACKC